MSHPAPDDPDLTGLHGVSEQPSPTVPPTPDESGPEGDLTGETMGFIPNGAAKESPREAPPEDLVPNLGGETVQFHRSPNPQTAGPQPYASPDPDPDGEAIDPQGATTNYAPRQPKATEPRRGADATSSPLEATVGRTPGEAANLPDPAAGNLETLAPASPNDVKPAARLFPAIPNYKILGVLGKGGMGIVYKARHLGLNRLVALKMILSSAHADDIALRRFKTEGEAVAKLQHPNIVQIYDVGTFEGHPFFALEFLEGGSLHDALEGTPQLPKRAAEMVEALARAMFHAHQQGIVHRDLKPANILMTPEGTPKITDFGLAKPIEQEELGLTRTGAILGTPTYMAPEQAQGNNKAVGPGADIYALGAILYDMLTGRPPLRGTTIVDTLQLVQFVDPVPPRQLQPKVPADLQTICLRCLHKEPNRRYSNAAELAEDLRAFLEDRPIKARPVSVWERTVKWARRKPAEALLAVVLLLAGLGLIAGLVNYAKQQHQLALKAEENVRLADAAKEAAEEKKQEAQARQKEAQEHEEKMKVERDKANDERKIAQENLGHAQGAVTDLIYVAQKRLPNEPHLERLREDILNKALEFSKSFLVKQSDNPAVRFQAAEASRLVGDIQEMLHHHQEAAKAYQEAIHLYDELFGDSDRQQISRFEAAGTYLNLWVVQAGLKEAPQASHSLERAQELLKGLIRDYPEKGEYRQVLAMTYNNEAIQWQTAGKLTEAEKSYLQALDLFAHVSPTLLASPSFQVELAKTEKNLGVLYQKQVGMARAEKRSANRYDLMAQGLKATAASQKAEAVYRRALGRLLKLVEAFPDEVAYRKELGEAYNNLAFLMRSRDPAAAEALYDEVIALYSRLSAQFQAVTDYRNLLALTLVRRAEARRRVGAPDKAQQDLEKALTLLDRLSADNPTWPEYQLATARALNSLGALLSTEDPVKARHLWEKARELCAKLPIDADREEASLERKTALLSLILLHEGQVRKLEGSKRDEEEIEELKSLVGLRKELLEVERSRASASGSAVPPASSSALAQEELDQCDHLAGTRLALIRTLVSQGKIDQAGRSLAELIGAPQDLPHGWSKYLDAAALASRSIDLARTDPRYSSRQDLSQRVQTLAQQALFLLRRAAEQGVTIPVALLSSESFRPLETFPEFQRFRADLAKKQAVPMR
jgi:tetratricopeptide (TPR) repeat protein